MGGSMLANLFAHAPTLHARALASNAFQLSIYIWWVCLLVDCSFEIFVWLAN
jgi:hypothetical protein